MGIEENIIQNQNLEANMTRNYVFTLPLSVILPRKTKKDRKIMLNLNQYRNLHFQVNNQVKRIFKPISGPVFKADKIKISYIVDKTTKRKFDTMNIISIVDKFFLDWLVENEYLPDDSFKNVSYGSIDGSNDCAEDRVIAIVTVL